MSAKFTHLHVHSNYSLLNALPKISDLVKKAKEEGMKTLALTDNGAVYGVIDFYKECKDNDIKPIIGVDAYVASRTRHDKEAKLDDKRSRLVLLAKNDIGYKNLLKIITDSYLEGFYYKPRIDTEIMQKYHEGLIAIIPFLGSDVSYALRMSDFEKAEAQTKRYLEIFGAENTFYELTYHPDMENFSDLYDATLKNAKNTGVELVASQEVYYISPEDRDARYILLSVSNSFAESQYEKIKTDYSFISADTAQKYFADQPKALENNQKIAEMCNVELKLGNWVFPKIDIPEGKNADDYLKEIVYKGAEEKGLANREDVIKRIEYELGVIKQKGYAPYFLVVSDLLRFAHSKKILTTIRGSVAGSMVTYLSRITNVNPIDYKLPFERFLNPERPSAPDIDMDYADNRRDEMITYAKEKYGYDKVAQIGTFGTMAARGSVKDSARALGFHHSLSDRISKLIPMGAQGFPMTIERAMNDVEELQKMYKEDEDVKQIIDMAKKIEGCARHISVHAAGVVIAPSPLTDFVALQLDPKEENKVITQFDMHGVEDAGLLKFDFLGIKNLSILANSVDLVKRLEEIEINIETVPLDDKKTFELLAKGETEGLFQLNGDGMTRYLKELKPTTIHDINAMVALYRPGPLEMIPEYIKRKHNPKLISYLDPRMKDILDMSFGVITYQDDVMMIAINLAGYSWLEADKLRKAMGKKIPKEMQAQKEKLLKGFVEKGMSEAKANELWGLIEPFAAYGFNKAHAASYGKVAYQTAYMKANYPAIYMCAVLTADSGNVEKVGVMVEECRRMKIPVLPPDINESFEGFTVVKKDNEPDKIRFGLSTIKNFGEGVAQAIIEERKKGGKFSSVENFMTRVHHRAMNKRSLEALIQAGAFDSLEEREKLLTNMDALLEYGKMSLGTHSSHDSLFESAGVDIPKLTLIPGEKISNKQKLTWEKELLGVYISGHPLDDYKDFIKKSGTDIQKIKSKPLEGMTVTIIAVLDEIREIKTKKGDDMAFIKVSDLKDTIEVVAFPKVLEKTKTGLLPGSCLMIKGKVSKRNDEVSILADSITISKKV